MVDFWVKMVTKYMNNGMNKEAALMKVPAKWRDAVRDALDETT